MHFANVRRFCVGLALLAVIGASRANAQGYGLPLGDTANTLPKGLATGAADVTIGTRASLYGARVSYALADDIRIFTDFGGTNLKDSGGGTALQGGLLLAFEGEPPLDLAARVAFYQNIADHVDVSGANAMLVGSMQLFYVGFYVYGGAGVNVDKIQTTALDENDLLYNSDRTQFSGAFTAGALWSLTQHWSMYLEASAVGHPFVGAGTRCQF